MKIVVIKSLCILLFVCLNGFSSPAQQRLQIEKGVSQGLAKHRSQVLNNINYRLTLAIPSDKSAKIDGTVGISFRLENKNAPVQIDFRQSADHLKNILVNGKAVKILFQNEHIIIDPKGLVAGTNLVQIDFIAGDPSLNRNDDYLYTLLVPDRARTVFPCFDQPDLKAKFQLSLVVPVGWKVVSNSGVRDSVIVAGDKMRYEFRESDLFSTYLFSFVAGRFTRAEKDFDSFPMQFLYRENDSNKIKLSVDTIFGWHRKALHFLEDYCQIKFPFQKLDFVGIPDFQYGGMEHVGAIDYRASTLFLDSGATKDQENGRANLIAHETSHMWFGDLVTMQWFNDVWMKEVFANFMADKITRGVQNTDNYELKFLLSHFPRAYAVDRTTGANPIRQRLENLQEAGNLYGAIIYDKAPVMMRQLETLMGADAFRDGLREYLQKYSFRNASWPDLIRILDNRTAADLESWNQVWVNTAGRPVISYSLEEKNNIITRFTISQQGEHSKNYVLPQFFKLAFFDTGDAGGVTTITIDTMTVNMNRKTVELKQAVGKRVPDFIIFNASGEGYGVFPAGKRGMPVHLVNDPLIRAATYINEYENMINGKYEKPLDLLHDLLEILGEHREPDELIMSLLTGYTSEIYWCLLSPKKRQAEAAGIENLLWTSMEQETSSTKKKLLFRTYQNVATTEAGLDKLFGIWKFQKPPAGLKLSEDEYTTMALNLVVKGSPRDSILILQLSRITNDDRRKRFEFLMPAVSDDTAVRDAFFNSLKDPTVRKKEAWVAEAVGYLHHPLRQDISVRYLKETLELLQQIQITGDIFFPAAWLNASFGSYQSKKAATIVRDFLNTHPGYNAQLKMKILQAADPLFRAEKLVD